MIFNVNGAITFLSFSNTEGGYGGTGVKEGGGNISADPMFVDPDGPDGDPETWEDNDYHLSAGSPSIDAGDNGAVPDGITTDLDGNPRFVDDPDTVDTGFGDSPVVDMGAYEFQGRSCPADLDGSGDVGFSDLLGIITAWGPCGVSCSEDLDGDDIVGFSDLLLVLSAWGPC